MGKNVYIHVHTNVLVHRMSTVYMYMCLLFSHSNQDHPLSRLLGEHQMEVFSLLKPIHSAVERAGGLVRLDIALKNEGGQGEWGREKREEGEGRREEVMG